MKVNFIARRFLIHVFLVLTFFVGTESLRAQQYNFLKYSVKNGLPQAHINCVFQDAAGFIWIGTEAGASRFDGQEFETYDASNGLRGNEVTAITETSHGILLATDSGVAVYFQGKFKFYKSESGKDFSRIYTFFTGLANENLMATDKGLFRFEDGKYYHLNTGTPLDDLPVRTGYHDVRNNLWIGTESNGLFELNYENGRYSNVVFPEQDKIVSAHIRGIVEGEQGELWIATSDQGLLSYDGQALNTIQLPEKLNTKYFTCLQKDAYGDIWLGTWGSGVIRYTKSVFKAYSGANGLGDDVVTCVSSDHQGNTWIGTYSSGLVFFYGDQFTSLTVKDGLPDNNVRAITEDDDGNMWFATLAGIVKYDGIDIQFWNEKNGLSFNRIGALVTDGKNIFAGTLNGDVNIISNGKVKIVHPPKGIELGEIISMLYTKDGSVWIGTVSNGLFRIANEKIESINTGNTLLRNPIWSLFESEDGVIWIGTGRGMYYMENGNAVKPICTGKNQPSLPVYGIQGDKTYIYFASQRNGIWRYNRKAQKFQRLDKSQGLSSDFTNGILRIDERSMYVTTMVGMDRIVFNPDTHQVRHFLYSEGIGTDNFNEGVIFYSKDGRLWLGSTDGVIIYSSANERNKITSPHIEIKSALLFNQETNWEEYSDSLLRNGLPFQPNLPYDKNQITFHLSGIQFGAGVNVRYEYMLEGFEKDWIQLPDGNSVSYSNLPPGDYRFQVRAGNSSNVFSAPYIFAFTISPPFWGTWWFFLLVMGFLSSIGILLIFLYQRFRTDFVRRHRSFADYVLNAGRMFLICAGILYPTSGYLCHVFDLKMIMQEAIQVSIGVLLLGSGIATFYNPFARKYVGWLSQLGLSLLIIHILYLNHLNHLHPVTVVMLAAALGAAGIVLDNIRTTTIFTCVLLITVGLLMFATGNEALYNRWIFLFNVIVCLVITFILVLSRLNLLNRLVFADTTINNTRSLVIAADENGKIIFASRSIRSILGYTEEEVLGDGWWKIRTDDPEENEKIKKQIHDTNEPTSVYVTALKTKNNTIKWIQWVDTVLEGGIKVGIGLDITDRREIEERYRHIVEAAIDIIYTADYKGKFTYINSVTTKITGYSNEDLIGRHFTEVVKPDYMEEVRTFYAKQFRKRTTNTYFEFPIFNNIGETIWLGQTVRLLFDETHPTRVTGFQAIARDITEKKRYEEELEKLSLVASETINGVLICDPNGRIDWVNEGFTRITGYTLDDVLGKLPGDVLAGDRTDASAISLVREQSKNAEGFHREFLVYNKQGYEIWIAVSNTPIVDENGKILRQIEIFNDITEKKRYEIQLDKYSTRLETLNMAKEELLRSETPDEVAHNVLGRLAERITYLRRTSLALFNERDGILEMLFVFREGEGKLGRIIMPLESFRSLPNLRQNTHFLVNDLSAQMDLSESDKENLEAGVRSYLVMPLFARGELIGSINIGSAKANAISFEDIEMIREVADAMANTLQQMNYRGIIEQKNNDISASILYARRIQDAILPPEEMLRDQMGDLFVLYKPKDVLSGDFYWAEKRGNYTFVAVVDSTGHGVPGALLSLMGQNLLNQAVHERNLVRPSSILDYLNAGIQHTLNQYKSIGELRDGMDISLCVFEHETMKMQFAGAINPMYIIRDDMLIQSKGNRFSIGSYFDNKMRPFTNQETELQEGDVIYLFTDGFSDQFGGEDDRKLSQRRFQEILMNIHAEEMSVQKRMLEVQLKNWMHDDVQTDDICVIGIRIKKKN
ncbi:MAG: PAS domain S-box protein [Bacteroidetes bacterium]|nr:PAS domain S-box protein [Bacteroidota bacterium]